ncbi:MAG: response regulator [Chromatiales bacterium]|nr:response regulator [Chromatiales bacterium]
MSKTIMIIDDSRVSRMMIKAMIASKHADWVVIEAGSGDEALTTDETSIDFFSVDLNMPGIDGIELIEKLRPRFPEAKAALMTANIQDAIKQRCASLDIQNFNKPITEESVAAMLEYFNG